MVQYYLQCSIDCSSVVDIVSRVEQLKNFALRFEGLITAFEVQAQATHRLV